MSEETTLHPFQRQAFSAWFDLPQSVSISDQLNCLLGFAGYKGKLGWLLKPRKVVDTNVFEAHPTQVTRPCTPVRRTCKERGEDQNKSGPLFQTQTRGQTSQHHSRLKAETNVQLVNTELFYFCLFQSCHRDIMKPEHVGRQREERKHVQEINSPLLCSFFTNIFYRKK